MTGMTQYLPRLGNFRARATRLAHEALTSVYQRTDRMFAGLLLLQWLLQIVLAVWQAPRTWAELGGEVQPHVPASMFLGGAIAALPVALAFWQPGRAVPRHVSA